MGRRSEAELVMQEYEGMPPDELQAQLQYMEKWAQEGNSTPLLVLGDSEASKKALLCGFLRQHRVAKPNWLHIAHFGSLTPNYAHILYQTTVQLRVPLSTLRVTSVSSRGSNSTRKNCGATSSTG